MLLVWSATQEKAVSRMVQGYDKWREARLSSKLRSAGELEQLAFTLAARRSYLPWRTFSIAGNSWPAAGFSTVKPVRAQENPAMALVFTGQGAQYSGMGMGLLRYPVFKTTLSKADDVFRDLQCEWSLFGEYRGTPLAPNDPAQVINSAAFNTVWVGAADVSMGSDIGPSNAVLSAEEKAESQHVAVE